LQETEESFRLAIEAGRMAVWEVDLETGTVTNSPELNLLFGFPYEARPSFADFRARYAPGEVERLAREGATLEEVRKQFASGKFEVSRGPNPRRERDPTQVQAEVSIVVPGGKVKHLLYRAQYIYSLEGRPKITGLLVDITDRKEAEERITVVARELQHRVKNSLTLVQSLARLTLRAENLDKEAVDRFLTRLQALATATNLVLSSANQGADLRDIVESITRPYRDGTHDPFVIAGPAYEVFGKATSAFSLIIHELCTNAVKYGSLSVTNGTVSLAWHIEPDQSLQLEWKERGGPPVTRPTRTGFGSRLISALVQGELKGRIEIDYSNDGIIVVILTSI
jgi:two-component sensor histidine kinase